jgi:hypothetical protein
MVTNPMLFHSDVQTVSLFMIEKYEKFTMYEMEWTGQGVGLKGLEGKPREASFKRWESDPL